MDYRNLSSADIRRLKRELEGFYNARMVLMWCAIGAMITAIAFLGLGVHYISINPFMAAVCFTFIPLSIGAGITLFILRSALFNKRIRNRETLLDKAAEYQKGNQ